jgi:hypothetical protein
MSDKGQHTPGPWQVLPEEDDRQYLRIRGTEPGQLWKIANVHHDPQAYRPSSADETRANASLIACAPDLLALVEEAIRLYGTPHWWNQPHAPAEWIARAQDAVAKARGTMSRTSAERSEGER